VEIPNCAPQAGEFQTLSALVNTRGTLDVQFDSPTSNWIVKALSLEPTQADAKPAVSHQTMAPKAAKDQWKVDVFKTDSTKRLLDSSRAEADTVCETRRKNVP
jgi:hypothetical protein